MQEGTLADGIQEWRVHVEVNGVARHARSVSIDASVASDLPDEVAGVSGISARTGTISWAPQNPVSSRPATPWTREGAWPPQPGDRVDVWAGDSGTSWKVFTGRIDSNEGGVDEFSSKIIDATDQLDRPISLDPVAHTMPGQHVESTQESWPAVRTFVQPWHAAYRCLRAGGFGIAAPTQVGGSRILEVDLQGSIWPTMGTLRHDQGSVETQMSWGDGYTYLSQGSVAYIPRANVNVPLGQAVRVWGRIDASPNNEGVILVPYSDEKFIRTRATLNTGLTGLTVLIEYWDGDPFSESSTMLGSASSAVVPVIEQGTVWWEVMLPAGRQVMSYAVAETTSRPGTPNGDVERTLDLGVQLSTDVYPRQISLGGDMIAGRAGVLTTEQWRAMSSQSSASQVNAWGRGLVGSQYVSRTQVSVNARDLLAEIGQATLTAMWIDEHGVMQWAPTNIMYLGESVRTFTTRDDIFSLGWQESLQATRHNVHGKLLNASVSIAENGYTKRLYQPDSADSLSGSSEVEFVEVPDDHEWFGVDLTMWRASSVPDRFNEGKGSFYAAVTEVGNDAYAWVGDEYSAEIERITPRTFKLTHSNSTGGAIQLMTHPDSTSLKRSGRGIPSPIIRGQGRAWFVEDEIVGANTGPSWAPDMTVDFGAWAIQGHAQLVVDWLSNRLSRPVITLTDVEVAYDPRIQLGDVVTIESRTLLGMTIDAVVVGKSETHGDGAALSLTVRVVRTRVLYTTYGELEAAYQGDQYAALQSAWTEANYGMFENSPLGRV